MTNKPVLDYSDPDDLGIQSAELPGEGTVTISAHGKFKWQVTPDPSAVPLKSFSGNADTLREAKLAAEARLREHLLRVPEVKQFVALENK